MPLVPYILGELEDDRCEGSRRWNEDTKSMSEDIQSASQYMFVKTLDMSITQSDEGQIHFTTDATQAHYSGGGSFVGYRLRR